MNLSDQVQGWCSVGQRARQAIKDLIRLRLAHSQAQGQGNKARRRAALIGLRLDNC